MIISITIENFLSIRKEIVLDLEATRSKRLKNNFFKFGKENYLKTIAIYGANASGKTNFIKAVNFIKSIIINSHKNNVGDEIQLIPFKLDNKYNNKPSKFRIVFVYNNIKYDYFFSLTKKKIIDEELYYYPNNRKSLIFKRTNTWDYEFNIDKSHQNLLKEQTIENTLYVSRATQLGYEKTKPIYEFFLNELVTSFTEDWEFYTLNKIYGNKKLKSKVIDFLKRTDFTIEDVLVEKKKVLKIDSKNLNLIEKEVLKVKFRHRNNEGQIIYFDLEEESDGTKQLFNLIGPIFNIIKNNQVLFFDEIEKSLHPELTRFLVELFNNANTQAQFIFTTHNTNLLDNELMRKDQIYFTQRNKYYATEFYSLSDFKDFRDTLDFEKAYLDGKFGAFPEIDRRIIEIIKQWLEE